MSIQNPVIIHSSNKHVLDSSLVFYAGTCQELFFGRVGCLFAACGLFTKAHRLLSSCGLGFFLFSSYDAWAPERVGSVVCGTWGSLVEVRVNSVVVARGLVAPRHVGC